MDVKKLNKDIEQMKELKGEKLAGLSKVEEGMDMAFEGVSRTVMLDRYTYKDTELVTLGEGDFVVLTVKPDPKFPMRGTGYVVSMDKKNELVVVKVEDEFKANLAKEEERETGLVERRFSEIEKPLELFYDQIGKRVAHGLASVEAEEVREKHEKAFEGEIVGKRIVPAGRVLYGAGAGVDVTFFNCFVLPFVHDSRDGINDHRKMVMNIMSRGGGVGTNGTTLRPKHALAKGVNGKSSGSVSWLNDIANLTNLVEQGGSRRGAQMIMLAEWHPDILEFIISKMQRPQILRYLLKKIDDEYVQTLIQDKLKFIPLTAVEREQAELTVLIGDQRGYGEGKAVTKELYDSAREKLIDGGRYEVESPEFLSGANISVTLTDDFMKAVENDEDYELKFPDIENYTKEEMAEYNEKWMDVGDVREWHLPVKTYRTLKARSIWDLINICATYSAEPGIFYIDNANEQTNAKAYGQKVVATNPCGEQPLSPYSVCNLAAVNLAEMADRENKVVDFDQLKRTVEVAVRMQDNVIDATPYFLEENTKQALGERRVGLGVMGLHDLLLYTETEYGSDEGNQLVDEVFKTMAVTAYRASVEIAKEKGSFGFLVGETEKETAELRRRFINTGYMKKMPEDVRESILKYGIRNSHLLTVAPTGSTGTMIGVSTGLEPYFSFSYYRSGRLGKFIEVKAKILQDYYDAHPEADREVKPDWFISAMELSPEAHVDVQCIIQKWVDSSLSKTVNAPKGYTVRQVQGVYERLYNGGAKGGTVYVDGSRDAQVLTLSDEENDSDGVVEDFYVADKEVVVSKKKLNVEFEGDQLVGVEDGDKCPVCQKGTIKIMGGCSTCTSCNAQVKCGL